jgi:Zn-dependent protease
VEHLPGDLREYDPIQPGGTDWRGLFRRIWAPIAATVGVLIKFSFIFFKFASIFVAVGAYALIWGWRFGIGVVVLLLAHEMGHYVEARRQGLHPALPIFIPFLGAYVAIRDAKINPWQHALIALAGPFSGGLGAAAVLLVGESDGSSLLQALAYFGFMLNLINLAPLWILDGAQIARSIGYLRRGGAPGRAAVIGTLYAGLAVALVLGMLAAHVPQHRL